MAKGLVKVDGDPRKLAELLWLLDAFEPMFEVGRSSCADR